MFSMKRSRNKKRICLLFGGKSGEHEVSLLSAKSIYQALDKKKYDVYLVGIDKSGRWMMGERSIYLLDSSSPQKIAIDSKNTSEVLPVNRGNEATLLPVNGKKPTNIDVFFPITHGTYGEDGSLQGMLELMDAAYVGAGVLGSAIGMDKDVMKRLLKSAGIGVVKFFALKKNEVSNKKLDEVVNTLGFPLFVKPANLGSSVGVTKVKNKKELKDALATAFKYDTKILIEEYIKGREIEVSVLGNDSPICSLPGEILPKHEFYSYEAKYLDENGAELRIPAKLTKKVIKKVQSIALLVFKVLECSGMARVDFFVTKKNRIYVNEINTLPGFTNISMYPKLWEASGVSYRQLLNMLIDLAIEKAGEKKLLSRDYNS